MKTSVLQLNPALAELLANLLGRIDTACLDKDFIVWDEVEEWPASALAFFESTGILEPHTPADRLLCLGCEMACHRPVEIWPDGRIGQTCHLRYDIPPMPLDPDRRKRWRMTPAKLASRLSAAFGQGNSQETLEGRIWQLGRFTPRGNTHDLFLVRGIWQPGIDQLVANHPTLQQAVNPALITVVLPETGLPLPCVALQTIMKLDSNGLVFSKEFLADALTSKTEDERIACEVQYVRGNIVLLNHVTGKRRTLSKPDFNSVNDNVFQKLNENPGKMFTQREVAGIADVRSIKSLHKIPENLKFSGILKQIFFNTSQRGIQFHNKVTLKELSLLGIDPASIK